MIACRGSTAYAEGQLLRHLGHMSAKRLDAAADCIITTEEVLLLLKLGVPVQ